MTPSQIGHNQYKLYFLYNNHLFLTSFKIDSSQEIYNHFIFDKLSNINKTEDDINLEIYKKTKLILSFRILFYKIILDKNIIYLLLIIDIILMIFKIIYDYEGREEKRKEIYNPWGRRKIIMDSKKNDFYQIQYDYSFL